MQASNRPQAAQEIYFLRLGILDDVLRKQIFNVCVGLFRQTENVLKDSTAFVYVTNQT